MKQLFLTWIILLAIVGLGLAQTQKTLVKTFPVTTETETVTFAMKGDATVTEWEKETIRIVTTIKAQNIEEKVLKALIIAGRYNYQVTLDKELGTATFDLPKMERTIFINGKDLEDVLEFEIFIPQGLDYQITMPNAPLLL